METLKIALDPGAKMPTRAHEFDAGLDLYAAERKIIRAMDWDMVSTGCHAKIPRGWVGLLTSKSGLMSKQGLTCRGTIDADYIGAIQAIVFNHSQKDYIVEKGDKVTQMVIVPCFLGMPEQVDELEETERGAGGFGSTGR